MSSSAKWCPPKSAHVVGVVRVQLPFLRFGLVPYAAVVSLTERFNAPLEYRTRQKEQIRRKSGK